MTRLPASTRIKMKSNSNSDLHAYKKRKAIELQNKRKAKDIAAQKERRDADNAANHWRVFGD